MAKRAAKKQATTAEPETGKTLDAVKGFDSNFQCRGYQYEVGKTYKHDGPVKLCATGFHACPGHPLDVFDYYLPAGGRYADVTLGGAMTECDGEKIAAAEITIKAELRLPDLIARAVKYVFDRAKPEEGSSATGHRGAASATGHRGAASATGKRGAASATGDRGAASATGYGGAASATGYQGAASATGNWGAASATGYQGAASATGDQGAASATGNGGAASATGYQGAASATGYQGAASATGKRGAASATGDRGAASATGNWGAASATGNWGAASATGYGGAAMASGHSGKVSGKNGNALFLVERDGDYNIIAVWAGIVGKDGIEPDVFYTLKFGKPVKAA